MSEEPSLAGRQTEPRIWALLLDDCALALYKRRSGIINGLVLVLVLPWRPRSQRRQQTLLQTPTRHCGCGEDFPVAKNGPQMP
jgi:hypothetical protein